MTPHHICHWPILTTKKNCPKVVIGHNGFIVRSLDIRNCLLKITSHYIHATKRSHLVIKQAECLSIFQSTVSALGLSSLPCYAGRMEKRTRIESHSTSFQMTKGRASSASGYDLFNQKEAENMSFSVDSRTTCLNKY